MTPTKEQYEKARKLCLSIIHMPVEGIADTYCFHCEEIAQFAADEAEAARMALRAEIERREAVWLGRLKAEDERVRHIQNGANAQAESLRAENEKLRKALEHLRSEAEFASAFLSSGDFARMLHSIAKADAALAPRPNPPPQKEG